MKNTLTAVALLTLSASNACAIPGTCQQLLDTYNKQTNTLMMLKVGFDIHEEIRKIQYSSVGQGSGISKYTLPSATMALQTTLNAYEWCYHNSKHSEMSVTESYLNWLQENQLN